jgi:1A family penicillin-binding protein
MSTHRNKRSYGFEEPIRREERDEPRITKKPIEQSTSRARNTRSSRARGAHSRTVWYYLWKIPFLIIYGVWKTLAYLWKKRPRLPEHIRQSVRRQLLAIVTLTIAIGFVMGAGLIAWASKDLPNPDKLTDRQVAESTKIYDRTGEHLLYEIFADQKRTIVELEDISPYVIQGLIATEDTKFYEHKGIRPLSIVRAIVYGIIRGQRIEGTSTLTQQLVKNAILTNERSLARKIKEAILSIRLEQKYTKDQILKIYFNEIGYGSTNYGIESAAQSYFGKSANELSLQEAATLAGMPKAPSTYLNNLDALKNRRDFVLKRMADEGYITDEEKIAAQAEPITLSRSYSNIKAPHFVLYVREQLVEQFGEHAVDTGGLKVLTTLDWEKQQIAERIVAEHATSTLLEANADNTSLVAMDPNTSQILTMIGSKDFYDESIDGQFNVATLGKRQPGSSFKPIIYTAAFELGYTPDTILYDVVTDFGANANKSYKPLNYDLSEHGPVTIRKALQGSLNIPAVKTLYLVGDQAGVDFAKRLGYSTFENGDFGLSLVLGGGEVTLLEHVNAYGVFANGGTYHKPVSILSVTDSTGDTLFEWKTERGERILEKEVTDTITNVLSDDAARTYAFGSGGILTLPERSVAAKTGTTNGYVDGWTMGYTPSLVAGVWTGNTNNTPMKAGFGGSRVAGPIWNAFMREALKDSPVESFNPLPEFDTDKPVLRGTSEGGVRVKVNKITGNLVSSSTPEDLIEERVYIQPHSILHYVIKDDPKGPVPEDPTADPQYAIWEEAIQDWVARKQVEDPEFNLEFGEVPTAVDDAYSLELIPSLTVVFPAPESTLTSRHIYTDIRVTAPRGVSKVTYMIDSSFVGVVRSHPFNLNYFAGTLENGEHTLTIIVEDDIGNRLEQQIPFTLAAGEIEPALVWRESAITESLGRSLIFSAQVFNQADIASARIMAVNAFGETRVLVPSVDFTAVLDTIITIRSTEQLPAGVWDVYPEIQTHTGDTIRGGTFKLTIQ